MLQRRLVGVLAVLMLLFVTGSSSSATVPTTVLQFGMVRVVGTVELVQGLAAPHYEVAGYVLVMEEASTNLGPLVGRPVVIVGTEIRNPSIYMRRSLQVERILELEGRSQPPATMKPPVDLFPAPVDLPVSIPPVQKGPPDPPASKSPAEVSLPGSPDPLPPLPPTNQLIGLPATPAPLPATKTIPITLPPPPFVQGTDQFLLFGRLRLVETRYYLVDPTAEDGPRYWVTSAALDLSTLEGDLIAAAAVKEPGDGAPCYQVMRAVRLSEDLSQQIDSDHGLIFRLPARPIAIVLRGSRLPLDSEPIIGNGRTLIGLRSLAEALGADVDWDSNTRTALVRFAEREIRATVGTSRIRLTHKGDAEASIYSDICPVIVNGRTMLPLRTVAELLGLTVRWEASTFTIFLD